MENNKSSGKNKPNILFFMPDQLRWDTAITDEKCRTPNLDRLVNSGVSFNNVYPTMAHCCPSRASLMTGLYPSQNGIFNNVLNGSALCKSLKKGVETFSEKLKENKYKLYYTGKWHVSAAEDPADRGWKEFQISCPSTGQTGFFMKDWKTADMTDKKKRGRGEVLKPGWGTMKLYGTYDRNSTGEKIVDGYEGHHDYRFIKDALCTLDKVKKEKSPWCLYVGPTGPHDPFIVPEKYAKMYDPRDVKLPPNYRDSMKNKPYYYKRMQKRWSQLSEQEVKESIAHYYGYVTMLDDYLGLVLDRLERNGLSENTIVIFTSDHGEFLGSHGLYCKGIAPYDEGYKVPLVISSVKHVKNPGRSSDKLISLIDLAPTVLELSGSPKLKKCAGLSLRPFIDDKKNFKWRDALYMQDNGVEIYFSQRIVRTERYKFVYNPVSIDELYDLEKDPYELKNLSEDKKYRNLKKKLFKRMWEFAFETDDDTICNAYHTVSMADYGPLIAR
ncbi:MAG: hypothetical protein A2X48_02070 [Lentisphaerae bacterium GWF2_49_21]|nr:MAG: hypothetical protein A2X48_02070 [Lentisphaerae bacterium GWF2_49_21]